MGWNPSKEGRSNPLPLDCVGEVGDPGEYQDESESDEGTISGSASSSAGWLVKEQDLTDSSYLSWLSYPSSG